MTEQADGYEVRDSRTLMHRIYVEDPEGVAETVGDVPVCPTCLRAFEPGKYGPVVCEDCWDEHIAAVSGGGKRYVTANGEKKHYTPLCQHVRGSQYRMTSDESCAYDRLDPCETCGPGGRSRKVMTDGGQSTDVTERSILHLFADMGIEDEVLATFGGVTRVGIDPETNPFSSVVRGDARDPPVSGTFDLAVAHPPCQRWSVATPGGGTDPEDHPDYIDSAREVCRRLADHYIIENVRDAPLRDPVVLTGGMFGMGIHYPRAFETSFHVSRPETVPRWSPDTGPLAEQSETGNAWVGSNDGWRLAKGYAHDWPARDLKRHAVPAPYLRRLLYHWMAAREDGSGSHQSGLTEIAMDGGQYSTETEQEGDDA